ncbi:MAG: peptidase MA family metallohydrolase [Gemmatimonadota bacterium]
MVLVVVAALGVPATVPCQEASDPIPALDFRVVRGSRVSVHFVPEDSARADRMLRFLEGQAGLPALPDTYPAGVELYLAPGAESYGALTGGRVPEWGAGVTVPALDRIVMPAYGGRNTRGRSEERVLRHEWAHLGLSQYLDGLRAPRWFDEGYAEWASGGWNAEEGWRLRVALAAGGGPSLDSLTLRWPRERSSAEVAYMLSGTAVEYLVRRSGTRGLEIFLERWTDLGSFEEAFRRTYGATTSQFEEDWREYVTDRYGWLFVLSHSVVFWLFLGVALTVMFWIRRRRNREAMARLRATEPPGTPDWWSGVRQTPGEAGTTEESEEPGVPERVPNDTGPAGSKRRS